MRLPFVITGLDLVIHADMQLPQSSRNVLDPLYRSMDCRHRLAKRRRPADDYARQ
jgi:hypothetical protein